MLEACVQKLQPDIFATKVLIRSIRENLRHYNVLSTYVCTNCLLEYFILHAFYLYMCATNIRTRPPENQVHNMKYFDIFVVSKL